MKQFLDLVRHVRDHGTDKGDRTGVGTRSVFGYQMRFDLSEGFPLLTEKATHMKSIVHELLWFLQGDTNIRYLKANGVSIWDEWVDPDTAVYEPVSTDELKAKLKKRFEVSTIVGIDLKQQQPEIDFSKDGDKVTFTINDAFWEECLAAGGDGIDVINKAHAEAYRRIAEFYGLDTQKLMAGALGPVYGAQWRSWPNMVGGKLGRAMTIAERCEEANQYGDYYRKLGEAYVKVGQARTEALSLLSKELDKLGIPSEKRSDYFHNQSIDQIKNVVEMIKKNPDSRRLIVSAWNPAQVDVMALPPCHALFQFYSEPLTMNERLRLAGGLQSFDMGPGFHGQGEILAVLDERSIPTRRLSCQLYQRSADIFLGVPFNIASYALLTHMVAHVTNHAVGDFIWTGGDCHLYSNHMEQVEELLSRTGFPLPTLKLNEQVKDIFGFTYDDITVENYQCHPAIKAKVAV